MLSNQLAQVNLFAVSQSISLDTVFNCSQFLQEIAHEQNFEVTWVDIDEKTTEGECRSDVDGGSYRAPLGLRSGLGSMAVYTETWHGEDHAVFAVG